MVMSVLRGLGLCVTIRKILWSRLFPTPTPHSIFESYGRMPCFKRLLRRVTQGRCDPWFEGHAETIVSSSINVTDDQTPRGLFHDFLKWLWLSTAIVWLLLATPLYLLGEVNILWGTLVGCLLPAVCFVAGFYAMCRNMHRPFNKLMVAFFGGMLARMLFIGLALLLILLLTQLHLASLLTSLFGFYILYLALEIYFVNGRFKCIKEGQQWA